MTQPLEPLKVNRGLARVFGTWRGGAPRGQVPVEERAAFDKQTYFLPDRIRQGLLNASVPLLRRRG